MGGMFSTVKREWWYWHIHIIICKHYSSDSSIASRCQPFKIILHWQSSCASRLKWHKLVIFPLQLLDIVNLSPAFSRWTHDEDEFCGEDMARRKSLRPTAYPKTRAFPFEVRHWDRYLRTCRLLSSTSGPFAKWELFKQYHVVNTGWLKTSCEARSKGCAR